MTYLIYFVLAALLLYVAYDFYQKRFLLKSKLMGGTSAFAKLAEADGKIIALKAATDVKKAEATAAHAALDEVHKLLG